jgi:serine/threonine-protein kinase
MTRSSRAPRDLLFGILALQNGLINQATLVAAFQAWTLDKQRDMGDILVEQRAMDPEDRSLLDALVAKHIKLHGDDAEESLAAVGAARSVRASLRQLADPEIDASLRQLGSRSGAGSTERADADADADRTGTYAVGTASAEGQRFRVLRPLARGGLGAVFVALDGELGREVALKQILDAHADDPISRQRFVMEAEITGGLEHPGIVPVYGLGTYRDGRPYYAMRFIRGDSLKEAIAAFHADKALKREPGRRSLELNKLLRRLLDVCNAIEYAHSRGVLHRDIKPGNVIVGRHGETLVVDWGLAKPLGRTEPGAGDERPLFPSSASGSAETLPGSALGTPAYMSPEQARGDLDTLGPRSDVYSLGATLYCLLTGTAPVAEGDAGAMLRSVQRGDVPKPRAIDKSIDRSLEAVCLKAMALKPEDRYATPRLLAEDIEHWIADQPVTAHREPWTTRARRWVGRHKTKVVAATVALVLVMIGLAGLLVVRERTNRELQVALDREKAANDLADKRLKLAQSAVEAFYTGASEDVVLKQPQLSDLRAKLLKTALKFYQEWQDATAADARSDPVEVYALTLARERVGEIQASVGSKLDAIAAYERALKTYDLPGQQSFAGNRAKTLLKISRLHRQLGQPAEALQRAEEARDIFEDLTKLSPHFRGDLGWVLLNMGSLQAELGRPREARKNLERALVVNTKAATSHVMDRYIRQDIAATHTALGNLDASAGRIDDALPHYQQALEMMDRLVAEEASNTEYLADKARALNNLGYAYTDVGKPVEAELFINRGLKMREELFTSRPVDTAIKSDLGRSHFYRARLRLKSDRPAEALEDVRRAEELFEGIPVIVPEDLYYRACLKGMHVHLVGAEKPGTADEQKTLRDAYAAETVRALQRAVAGGFRNLAAIQHDTAFEFAPVKDRPDFQATLKELAASGNTEGGI